MVEVISYVFDVESDNFVFKNILEVLFFEFKEEIEVWIIVII